MSITIISIPFQKVKKTQAKTVTPKPMIHIRAMREFLSPPFLSSNIGLAKLLDVLLAVGVVNVANLGLVAGLLVDVEGEAVVLVERQALLDAVHQVWRGNVAAAKDNDHVVHAVAILHSLNGRLGGEAASNEDGLLAAPGLQGKVEAFVLGVTVDD